MQIYFCLFYFDNNQTNQLMLDLVEFKAEQQNNNIADDRQIIGLSNIMISYLAHNQRKESAAYNPHRYK